MITGTELFRFLTGRSPVKPANARPPMRERSPRSMREGAVIWITGRDAAENTKLAARVWTRLRGTGVRAVLLDADAGASAPGAWAAHRGEAGRDAFHASLARLTTQLASRRLVVVVAAAPETYRARSRAASPRYLEVGIGAALEVAADVTASGADDDDAVDRIVARVTADEDPDAVGPPSAP